MLFTITKISPSSIQLAFQSTLIPLGALLLPLGRQVAGVQRDQQDPLARRGRSLRRRHAGGSTRELPQLSQQGISDKSGVFVGFTMSEDSGFAVIILLIVIQIIIN